MLRPVSILMAVVASTTRQAQRRLLDNVRSVNGALFGQRSVVYWAVCSYEDKADEWAEAQRLSAGALVLVMNASTAQQKISRQQRRAKMHHRAQLVERAWQLAPNGQDAFDFVWFLDEDISFKSFDMSSFLHRWMCAFGEAGPPVIAQPTLANGTRHGQGWPQSADTYRLCLTGHVGRQFGDDPCFLRRALAVRNDWVEQWAALIDAKFLAWWLEQATTKKIMQQQLIINSDFGADEIWCGAADEWVRLLGTPRSPRRVPCAVVTLPVVHEDSRTQGASLGPERIRLGHRLLWKAGLRWNNAMVGKECMSKVCCRGRNCSEHSWWRYTPWPGWKLPTTVELIHKVRACVATRLACPSYPRPHRRTLAGEARPAAAPDLIPGCGGLTDLWWEETKDTWSGGA